MASLCARYNQLMRTVRRDQCDDVIILQFDWTFLVLGNRAKYLNLVHQTVFRVRTYTCMGWVQDYRLPYTNVWEIL